MLRFRTSVAAWMLATSLLLQGCSSSSAPPPLIQTVTKKVYPPDNLMADIPPPHIIDPPASRDDVDNNALSVAGYVAQFRKRMADLRAWASDMRALDQTPPAQ